MRDDVPLTAPGDELTAKMMNTIISAVNRANNSGIAGDDQSFSSSEFTRRMSVRRDRMRYVRMLRDAVLMTDAAFGSDSETDDNAEVLHFDDGVADWVSLGSETVNVTAVPSNVPKEGDTLWVVLDEELWVPVDRTADADTLGPQLRITTGTLVNGVFDAKLLLIDPSTLVRTLSDDVWCEDLANATTLTAGTDYLCHYLGRGVRGSYFISIIPDNVGHPLSEGMYWLEVVGPIGSFMPLWDDAAEYLEGDVVFSGGDYYVCILDNIDQPPPDATYWVRFVLVDAGGYDGETAYSVGNYVQEERGVYDIRSDGLTAVISDTIIGDQDNYNPTGLSTALVIRVTSLTGSPPAAKITGIVGGSAGRVLFIENVGTVPFTLANEDTGSTAANRIVAPDDVTVAVGAAFELRYDSTSSRWRVLVPGSASAAGWAGQTFSQAGLVSSGDQMFHGKKGNDDDYYADTVFTTLGVFATKNSSDLDDSDPWQDATTIPAGMAFNGHDHGGGIYRTDLTLSSTFEWGPGSDVPSPPASDEQGNLVFVMRGDINSPAALPTFQYAMSSYMGCASQTTGPQYQYQNGFDGASHATFATGYTDYVNWIGGHYIASGPLSVAGGGTGSASLTSGQLIAGNGTSAVNSMANTRNISGSLQLKLASDRWMGFARGTA